MSQEKNPIDKVSIEELVQSLKDLSAYKHDDLSVCDEAAEVIETLLCRIEELEKQGEIKA